MWRRENAFHGSVGWVVQAKTSLQRIFLASALLVRSLCPVKDQSLGSKQRQYQYLFIFLESSRLHIRALSEITKLEEDVFFFFPAW